MPHRLEDWYEHSGATCCLHLVCRTQSHPKQWQTSTKLRQCCNPEQHSLIWYVYRVPLLSCPVHSSFKTQKTGMYLLDIPQLLLCCRTWLTVTLFQWMLHLANICPQVNFSKCLHCHCACCIPTTCMLGHTTCWMIPTVHTQITCLLVKYKQAVGTQ